MSWFRKLLPPKIKHDEQREKKAVPEGLWSKCPSCEAVLYFTDLEKNLHVCPKCAFHNRLSARQRLDLFLDPEGRAEFGSEVIPVDALKFKDSRKYIDRLEEAERETGETDALVVMQGSVMNVPMIAAVFEFGFLGGSMGSVVGERFVRAVQACCDERVPFVCFTATGGARMQEGLLSLMQMAKTTTSLHQLSAVRQPFISVLTDPTMGGVSASFAFIGDVVIAEPGALIGFAGPRVIEQTVRETLPEGFQRSEFLLEKGAIDMIVDRRQLREKIARMVTLLKREPAPGGLKPLQRTLDDWLAYISAQHPSAIALGLDRVQEVAGRMQLKPPRVAITVGGTNGKGSTCAFLERILLESGYKVGCYTSPHLIRYNERVRLQGEDVADAALVESFERVEAARGATQLTYFEYGTLAALWLFSARDVDCAILEVGLGGRLDAVNIIDADVAIVTSVDLDHQAFLGNTREAIGGEKAGIFRKGRPALFGDVGPPESLVKHAQAIGADLQILGRDFGFALQERQWEFRGRQSRKHALPVPALRGAWQLKNASCALAALDEVADRLPVSLGEIKRGLTLVRLAGRLQVLPGQPTVVLDVAHNPHAARSLADGLLDMGFYPRTIAVFAMLSDKDIGAVIDALKGRIDQWFVATVASDRAASAAQLSEALAARGYAGATRSFATVAQALDAARREAAPNDRICIFGSFFTVAEALEASR